MKSNSINAGFGVNRKLKVCQKIKNLIKTFVIVISIPVPDFLYEIEIRRSELCQQLCCNEQIFVEHPVQYKLYSTYLLYVFAASSPSRAKKMYLYYVMRISFDS